MEFRKDIEKVLMKKDAGDGRYVIAEVSMETAVKALGKDPTTIEDEEGYTVLSTDKKHRFKPDSFETPKKDPKKRA